MRVNHINLLLIFSLSTLLMFLASCKSNKNQQYNIITEVIELSKKNPEFTYDSVYIKKDTMYYYRNNEFKGKTVVKRE